ncbi:hypothetical protein SAMN04487987_10823 [Algibacter pectinivorans]|uniref:Uncharacterized protein n=1 Tax=Algibacter pectinivorans TaxID=870482 RepID=A0A1I1QZS2_9FLAO|nr:hypothetical protein SAMN04487987_10823 [Algibacter pectinivorans]
MFNNVPSGNMCWLKNRTKEKEELAFFYHDNKQFFVNHNPHRKIV